MPFGRERLSRSVSLNDLSVASRFTARNPDQVTPLSLALANLCAVCARADELLSPMPKLRDVARSLVATALSEAGANDNPDGLFLNRRDMDGLLSSSVSLTEGMIQTLIEGVDVFDSESMAVYTRHDTVDEAFLVPQINGQGLKLIFTYVHDRLSNHYLILLYKFWTEVSGDQDVSKEAVALETLWATLQLDAFCHEAEISRLNGELNEGDKARLDHFLTPADVRGVYRISFLAPGQPAALLRSAFVVTHPAQSTDLLTLANNEGPVLLLSARQGVEKFGSLAALNEALHERFTQPQTRTWLLEDVLMSEAEQLSVASSIEFQYHACSGPLTDAFVQMLRAKQVEDLRFTMAGASKYKSALHLLKAVEMSQKPGYVDDAWRQRVQLHMQRLQEMTTPHWLKYASVENRQSYEVFEAEYRRRTETANQLLVGLESVEQYAAGAIDDYMCQHLGYSVDATQVVITLQDKWISSTGELTATYSKSLLEFALDGLPSTANESAAVVALPEASAHPAFTFEFASRLIADLDVRYQYRQKLKARFRQVDTQRALLHQRDSGLALSVLAAQLQGHFSLGDSDDRSQELIWAVRGDHQKQGATRKMGGLEVGRAGNQLRDVIVFCEETETDTHFVLYAPGAPGGRDMFEFDTWRKLYHEVAGWSASPGGREYLISQSAPALRNSCAKLMHAVSKKPTSWRMEDVRFAPLQSADFQFALGDLINTKIRYDLADLPVVISGEMVASTYSHRRNLATLDARIKELNNRYEQRMNLTSYTDYARQTGARAISRVFQRTGINQAIDPDSVYFDLQSRNKRSRPDFGPYTDLVSLTQLLMNDFTYRLDDQAPMYSSTGQDLSALSISVVKEVLDLPLGEKYVELLKRDYTDRGHPEYRQRRVLFAQRMYFAMVRDSLITYVENGFSHDQYQWVRMLLSTVYPIDTGRFAPGKRVANSSINSLYLNGRLIEGVLVFKNGDVQEADYPLIYTPDAPDGLRFRTFEVFVSTLTAPGMDAYYYNRVSYKSQPAMGTFFSQLQRDLQGGLASMTFDADERVSDLQSLHDRMIERMMQDVDEQSLSKAESFVDSLYTLVKWTGTIFLLPFPPAALAWGLLHTSVDVVRGYLAYLDGDRAAASGYYAWGVLGVALGGLAAKDIVQATSGLGLKALTWAARKSHPGFA